MGALFDVINRGAIGGTLGAPSDVSNTIANLLRAGYGYTGHKLGYLTPEEMPEINERPFLGSEHIGQMMQDAGMVSPERHPLAEFAASAIVPVGGKLGSDLVRAARLGKLKAPPPPKLSENASNPAWLKTDVANRRMLAKTPEEAAQMDALLEKLRSLDNTTSGIQPEVAHALRRQLTKNKPHNIEFIPDQLGLPFADGGSVGASQPFTHSDLAQIIASLEAQLNG